MTKYIGARYMPKFVGVYDATQAYEALSVVDNGSGTSYVSNQPVPAGTPLTDTTYWAVYGSTNGAILNLQQQINDMKDETVPGSLQDQINDNTSDITALKNNIRYVEQYGAVGDGVTDDTTAIQNAIDDCITNHCILIAAHTYKVSSIIISANIYDGFNFIFNIIKSATNSPTIIIEGQSILLSGNILVNDVGDALQCGGDNYGLAGSTVNINYIKATLKNCLTLKAHSSQNIQNCVFNITRMVYYLHAVNIDTTNRWVGEITFNNTWFCAIDASLNNYAIYSDCANHGMTGMYLNSCSFEGAGGGIQALNTSHTDDRMFSPLFGFGLRVSELCELNGKTFFDYHGTGRLNGAIYCDSIPLDKIIINDALNIPITSSEFSVNGRIRLASGLAVFSDKAVINNDKMALVLNGSNLAAAITSTTTYNDTLPPQSIIRASGDITFSLSTIRFIGAIKIIGNASNVTITVNNRTYTLNSGDVLYIENIYQVGVGYRYTVTQNNSVDIINPI